MKVKRSPSALSERGAEIANVSLTCKIVNYTTHTFSLIILFFEIINPLYPQTVYNNSYRCHVIYNEKLIISVQFVVIT